ncbi:hypothetical protein Bca101_045492 [Brassica carinata]
MADQKDLDPNPPLEDRTVRPLKSIAIAHESEPELKQQKLEELQRKAYHSVLRASKAETSPTSHEKIATSSLTSVQESLVGKCIRSRFTDEDDLPSNEKQAFEDVLHAFNAESPTLSSSRALIIFDECNSTHRAHISAKIDDKVKTDPSLVEPFIKTFNTIKKFYPDGCRFRPSDDMMANYYLKNKVLGQPMKARIIPGECYQIFSIPPRDLPGYPRETEWHCYCRKPNGQESRNLWTRVGEDTTVFDPQGNSVGIKRTYALTDQEEESDDIFLPGEIEPPREEWFIEEISLPSSVADTDLVDLSAPLVQEIRTL